MLEIGITPQAMRMIKSIETAVKTKKIIAPARYPKKKIQCNVYNFNSIIISILYAQLSSKGSFIP